MLFKKRIAKKIAGALAFVMAFASVGVLNAQAASPASIVPLSSESLANDARDAAEAAVDALLDNPTILNSTDTAILAAANSALVGSYADFTASWFGEPSEQVEPTNEEEGLSAGGVIQVVYDNDSTYSAVFVVTPVELDVLVAPAATAFTITPSTTTVSGGTDWAIPAITFTAAPTAPAGAVVNVLAYAVVGGTLPAGLSLNATTGAITGTPTAVANGVTVSVQAVAANAVQSNVVDITFYITAVGVGSNNLQIPNISGIHTNTTLNFVGIPGAPLLDATPLPTVARGWADQTRYGYLFIPRAVIYGTQLTPASAINITLNEGATFAVPNNGQMPSTAPGSPALSGTQVGSWTNVFTHGGFQVTNNPTGGGTGHNVTAPITFQVNAVAGLGAGQTLQITGLQNIAGGLGAGENSAYGIFLPIGINIPAGAGAPRIQLTATATPPVAGGHTQVIYATAAAPAAGVTVVQPNPLAIGAQFGQSTTANLTLNFANQGAWLTGGNPTPPTVRGLTFTVGSPTGNVNSLFQFHPQAENPTIQIHNTTIPIVAMPSTFSWNVETNTLSVAGTDAAAIADNIAAINSSSSFAFFSHGNSRLNVIVGNGHTAAGVANSPASGQFAMTISNITLGARAGVPFAAQNNVPLVVGSSVVAGANSFGNNINGSSTHSVNIANFVAQNVTLTAAAVPTNPVVSGRNLVQGVAPTAASPNLAWDSFAPGITAQVTLAEATALAAAGIHGISSVPFTFTLTDAEGNVLPQARIAAVSLNNPTTVGGITGTAILNGFGNPLANDGAAIFQNRNAGAGNYLEGLINAPLIGGHVEGTPHLAFSGDGHSFTVGQMNRTLHTTLLGQANVPLHLIANLRISTEIGFEGPVYLTVREGTGQVLGGFEETVHIANAINPVTITAQTTNISTGISAIIPVGNIVVTENIPGALLTGQTVDLRITQPHGWAGFFGLNFAPFGHGNVAIANNGGTALTLAPNAGGQIGAGILSPEVAATAAGGTAVEGVANVLRLTANQQSLTQGSTLTLSNINVGAAQTFAGTYNLRFEGTFLHNSSAPGGINSLAGGQRWGFTTEIPYITVGAPQLANLNARVTAQTGTPFITVDGTDHILQNASGQAVSVVNVAGFNMLPLRGISDAFNLEVSHSRDANGDINVFINAPGRQIRFVDGGNVFFVNGVASPQMEATVQNIGGSTFLPFRYLGLALDVPVTWEWVEGQDGVQRIFFNQPNVGQAPSQNPNFANWE